MNRSIESLLLVTFQASSVSELSELQSLWSGYGSIKRYSLRGAEQENVIVKQVSPPSLGGHPRGWNTNLSHERKLRSYEVEEAWYRNYAGSCGDRCRVPQCYAAESDGDELTLVLEDLDAAGYADRKLSISWDEALSCVSWLANFHATFLGHSGDGLWQSGTYWHLETRPDELARLAKEDCALHAAAKAINQTLKDSSYQTLVHGDAKLANFCFTSGEPNVAAVDFQYVGRGCGMKDLAYFVGSCMDEEFCGSAEEEILDFYFDSMTQALVRLNRETDARDLEDDWRPLYRVAWADFHRFLKGWSPGHWKINSYSERVTREVVRAMGI